MINTVLAATLAVFVIAFASPMFLVSLSPLVTVYCCVQVIKDRKPGPICMSGIEWGFDWLMSAYSD